MSTPPRLATPARDEFGRKKPKTDWLWVVFLVLVVGAIVLGACSQPKAERLPGSPIEEIGRACAMRFSLSRCVEMCRISYVTGTEDARQCVTGAMRISPDRYKRP